MKKSYAALGVGFASLLSCHGAIAEAPSVENSWYFQASGGRAWLNDMVGEDHQVVPSGKQTTTSRKIELGSKKTFDFAIGRAFGNSLRADLEYAYRSNIIDKHINTRATPNTVLPQVDDSDVRSHSLLANLYFDFHNTSPITPYLGIGLGLTNVNTKWTALIAGSQYRFEDSDWTYAGQLTAGANWAVTPNWGIFAQYRYFVAPDIHTSASVTRTLGNVHETLTFKDDYISQSFSLGVRYSF